MTWHGENTCHIPRGTTHTWVVCELHTGARVGEKQRPESSPASTHQAIMTTTVSTQGASFSNLHKCPLNMVLAGPGICEVSVRIN